MAALNFPNNPSLNQVFTANDTTWRWDGRSWVRANLGTQGVQGIQGIQGVQGTQGVVGDTYWRIDSVGIHTTVNVGIGTTTADSSYALDIHGDTRISGILTGNVGYLGGQLEVTGIATFQNNVFINGALVAGSGGGGASIGDDIVTRNLYASGVSTFVGAISGSSASFTGDVTVGGELRYEDVTNVDSIGIATARSGLRVTGGGLDVVGVATFNNGVDGIDVIGHTELDNVNVSGVLTASSFVGDGSGLTGLSAGTTPTENTTNQSQYIPFYVGTSTTDVVGISSDSFVFNPSTNRLGVGTDSPQATLHVVDELLVSTAGAASTQRISQRAYTIDNGTLSWEGSAGQLFSVTNNLTSGSIFSVNDVSGIPSIDVDADGTIQIAPYGSTEYVGIGLTNPTQKLDVDGNVRLRGPINDYHNNVGAGNSVLISTGIGVSWIDIATAALQGVQGVQGTQGTQGIQGIQGIQGTQGITGAQGTYGAQGTQGTYGTQGTQGIQGVIGNIFWDESPAGISTTSSVGINTTTVVGTATSEGALQIVGNVAIVEGALLTDQNIDTNIFIPSGRNGLLIGPVTVGAGLTVDIAPGSTLVVV